MRRLIILGLSTALGLWLSSQWISGVTFSSTSALIWAVLVLGLVNIFVRPILVVLTLPLTILTLGLFLLVVNAAMIGLTAWFMDGFQVAGFWPGMGAALVTGVINWLATIIFLKDQD